MKHESQLAILVVDTNPETLFPLANELGHCGYRVLAAKGADEAIAIGESNTFEVLLCKQLFGDSHALHLLGYMRRCKHLRQLRLIAMSSAQLAGVRLHHRDGQSVYSIRSNVRVDAIVGVIRQTMHIPVSYSRSDVGVFFPSANFCLEAFSKH
jgi:CheY-like chemotaxis protein